MFNIYMVTSTIILLVIKAHYKITDRVLLFMWFHLIKYTGEILLTLLNETKDLIKPGMVKT